MDMIGKVRRMRMRDKLSISEIAKTTRLSRNTIKKWLNEPGDVAPRYRRTSAEGKFPVTDWLRTPAEFDYIVEPDVFHDLFGHVPLLFNPVFADHMQEYGKGGLKAHGLGACEQLSRLYWYTVEFGLIRQKDGLRAYGAGILSSSEELQYSVKSPEPQRIALDVLRTMRTRYKIDSYQQTYFVINSFQELFDKTAPDFTPIYQRLKGLPEIEGGA